METTSKGAALDQAATGDAGQRLRTLVNVNFSFVWRLLKSRGLTTTDAEDASQQVFLVLVGKLDELEEGKERAFLYGTALRIAWRARRTLRRRREVLTATIEEDAPGGVRPDQILQQREASLRLSEMLESLPGELVPVLVLFEVEELTLTEISNLLSIPRGTVASRLRRGREVLQRRFRNDLPSLR